jgi:hypothetical protein
LFDQVAVLSPSPFQPDHVAPERGDQQPQRDGDHGPRERKRHDRRQPDGEQRAL